MTSLMQYAKCTDPEVVAIVADNAIGLQRAVEKACAWAESKGSLEGFYGGTFLGVFRVVGLPLKEKPKGWANAQRGYRPRADSLEYRQMQSLEWSKAAVPGLPSSFVGATDHQGRTVWMTPAPFVSGGAAWLLLSQMPVKGNFGGEFGPQWVEVKASEAYAAKEAFEAQQQAESEAA